MRVLLGILIVMAGLASYALGGSGLPRASVCGGTCVNTGSHAFMDTVCSDNKAEIQCGQFTYVGCSWKPRALTIVRGSSCIGEAAVCGTLKVQKACIAIDGCAWFPAAFSCHN